MNAGAAAGALEPKEAGYAQPTFWLAPPRAARAPARLRHHHAKHRPRLWFWCRGMANCGASPCSRDAPRTPPPSSGEPGGARNDANGGASLAPAPQGNDIPAGNGIPALLEPPLTRTGTGSHELTSLSETPEASIGASFLDGDTTLPHRVLICWREGCGRHSARQSGGPSNVELYCCVPCAQL